MRTAAPLALALISLPAAASDLDDINGWRATSTLQVGAEPAQVFATAGDLTTWKNWTAWSSEADPSATWEYEGDPNTVGHEMTWMGPELGTGRLVITGVQDDQFTFDLFFGKSGKASKGTFGAVAAEGGTMITWDTAGPMGAFGRLFFSKKVSKMVVADYEEGLANLKPIAEHNQAIADAEAKAAALETAAATAEADAATKAEAAKTAQAALDEASATLAKARRRSAKAAAQEGVNTATTAATEAGAAAEAASAAAELARKDADAAKAAVATLESGGTEAEKSE